MEISEKKYRVTSDRCSSCSMPGVWRAAGYNDNAVVIFHSPKACAHVTRDLNLKSFYYGLSKANPKGEQYGVLLTSDLKDDHSIFGGEDRLMECIRYAVHHYQPEYIMIANSCVAGIIGDDTQKVVQLAEEKFHVPVLTVPCYGFLDGTQYYEGFYHASVALIERFMQQKPKLANKVTIIGDVAGQTLDEIQHYLRCFDLEVGWCFPRETSLRDIQDIPSSALLITVGSKAGRYTHLKKIAKVISEKFDIPVVNQPFPVGWAETKQWLVDLGALLGKTSVVEEIITNEAMTLKNKMQQFVENLQHRQTALIIGRPVESFDAQWLFEFLNYCQIQVQAIVTLSMLSPKDTLALKCELENYTNVVIYTEDEYDDFSETDFVMTTHELKNFSGKQFIIPLFSPYGIQGMIRAGQQLNYLQQRKISGGRSNCGKV